MPEDLQSRFTVYERPEAPPGKCVVCGAVDRPVIDFGVDIEWADTVYGRAYFCVTCIKQAAAKFPDESAEQVYSHPVVLELFGQYKEDLTNGIIAHLKRINPGAFIPVYGDFGFVPEQTEPTNTQDPEPELRDDKPKPRRLTTETASTIGSKGTAGVSGDSSDGESPVSG
jgi:hypothetical protein